MSIVLIFVVLTLVNVIGLLDCLVVENVCVADMNPPDEIAVLVNVDVFVNG